jgi:hypothetical protein
VITRREIVTGGMLTGALGGQSQSPARDSAGQRDSDERAVGLLGEIRDELKRARPNCHANDCPEVERIRAEQRTFLKGRSKFPDYLDLGVEVWDRVCDWHIERGLPLQVTRMVDGRYSMPFFQTFLVLRPDVMNTYIGPGYDK